MGVDLGDLGSERLSFRRLRVLLSHLPQESRTVRAIAGDKAMWSLTDHLLAAGVDALRIANWQRGKKGAKRPKPIPRPGVKDGKRRIGKTDANPRQVARFLASRAPKG